MKQHENLTQTAMDCGYFDQAHFNHEFRHFTGLTPGELSTHPISPFEPAVFYILRAAERLTLLDMKKAIASFAVIFGAILFLTNRLDAADPDESNKTDRWKPLLFFIGVWEGDVAGQPGNGKAQREYTFVLNDRFVHVMNRSSYPPQEKNPKGETHEDVGFLSYDKGAKRFMLRQFHIEGFVNQFAMESVSEENHTITFVSTAIENLVPGWRARETYRIINDDEFTETFSLAPPNHDFETYSETHFRRRTKDR